MENAVLFLWDSWTVLGRVVALLAIIVFVLGCESIAIKLFASLFIRRKDCMYSLEIRLAIVIGESA